MKPVLTFCAILLHLLSIAQSTQPNKTIFELLNVKGNCPVIRMEAQDYASVVEGPGSWGEAKLPKVLPENFIKEFSKVSKFEKLYTKTTAPVVKFRNGNFVFKKESFYGIKNAKGIIIVQPEFDHIFPDTTNTFIGYKNEVCNYYDAVGKKKFKEDYYFIEKTKVNSFIVQTDRGFGVISSTGNYLIKPAFYRITPKQFGKLFTYNITIREDQEFTLLENLKDTIWSNPFNTLEKLDNEHWFVDYKIINIKKNTKLFCDPGFYIEKVSSKHKLFLVSNGSGKKYLIDYKGNLISDESFESVWTDKNNEDRFVATLSRKKNSYDQPLSGLMDPKGNWLITPLYHTLRPIGKDSYVAQINGNKTGIINSRNKELLRFQYKLINAADEGLLYALSSDNGKESWRLIRLTDFKIIQSDLLYNSIYPFKLNGKKYYIAGSNEGEFWLDEKFKSLLPKPYTRIFPDQSTNTVDGYDSKNSDHETQKFTANGNLITFNIEGTHHNRYRQYIQPDSLFSYIYFNDGKGYYFLPDESIATESNHWYRINHSGHKDFYIASTPDNKYGLINSEGQTIIPPIFEHLGRFDPKSGLAVFNFADKKRGFITTEGTFLFNNEYDEISPVGFELFRVKKNDNYGIINRSNNIILPVIHRNLYLVGGLFYTNSGRYTIKGKNIN